MNSTDFHVWKRGLLRTRYVLADDAGDELGRYDLGPRKGTFTAADGRETTFETDGASARVTSAGTSIRLEASGEGPETATVDGRALECRVDRIGGRSMQVLDDERRAVVDARSGGWRKGPFRSIAVRDDLADSQGVAAFVGFVLIYGFEDLRRSAAITGTGGGGGS